MNFIHIEGGYFNMGGGYGKSVYTSEVDDFYLADMLFTQRDWLRYLEEDENKSYFKGNLDRPVENQPFYTVQYFIDLMNDREPGKNYRLPTEMEWEYAARGGRKSKGYLFAGSNDPDDVAWYSGNSDFQTHPVGQKPPNELGLYDMSGNVWEFCSDVYKNEYYHDRFSDEGVSDQLDIWGLPRLIRGGGWINGEGYQFVSCRSYWRENEPIHFVGFRVARDG